MAGGEPNAPMGGAPADPMAGAEQGDTAGDLGMVDSNMDGLDDQTGAKMPDSNQDDGGDSTVDIINQLSPTDREAVRAYAESMLSRDETPGAEMETGMGGEEPVPGQNGQDIMMEITKGRLVNVQKKLYEMFGDTMNGNTDNESDRKQKKVVKNKKGFKSPFDSPLD